MGLILTNEEIFDFGLLSFCKLRSESYTLLSKLAKVIHCIPSSSLEIERVWSRAGLILTDRRSRMINWNFKVNFKVNLFCSNLFNFVKKLHQPSAGFFTPFDSRWGEFPPPPPPRRSQRGGGGFSSQGGGGGGCRRIQVTHFLHSKFVYLIDFCAYYCEIM